MSNTTTILQRKSTSKFHVCRIIYTIIGIAQWDKCARKIIMNVFTNKSLVFTNISS